MGDTGSIAEIASATAAWVALLLSIGSLWYARKAQLLANQKEERLNPKLKLYVQDSFVKKSKDTQHRTYSLLLSVTNRSDANNSISEIDLCIIYTSPTGTKLTLRVRNDSCTQHSAQGSTNSINIGARLDAHQTLIGWCHFNVDGAILKNAKIENYKISITDSHGHEAAETLTLIREYSDETVAQKSKI
ncbi:hypothetical protein [Ferrovibrio sp.]|uniref:hypothetical protein n=1 Tax=Ferrovibrio sp. TaxID=1917215 RepID=UPI003D2C3BA5